MFRYLDRLAFWLPTEWHRPRVRSPVYIQPARVVGEARQQAQQVRDERVPRLAGHQRRAEVDGRRGGVQGEAVQRRLLTQHAAGAVAQSGQQRRERAQALDVQVGDEAAGRVQRQVLAHVGAVDRQRVGVVEARQRGGEQPRRRRGVEEEQSSSGRVGPEPALERRVVERPRAYPVGHLHRHTPACRNTPNDMQR